MFKLGQRLQIKGLGSDKLEGATGINLGTVYQDGSINLHMILLDIPTETHLAIQVISSCLTDNIDLEAQDWPWKRIKVLNAIDVKSPGVLQDLRQLLHDTYNSDWDLTYQYSNPFEPLTSNEVEPRNSLFDIEYPDLFQMLENHHIKRCEIRLDGLNNAS